MGLAAFLGANLAPFFVMTIVLFGGAAALAGQALARNWRPVWQTVPYSLLLGIGNRFLLYALFGADLLSASGYIVAVAILLSLCLLAYRATRVRRMVTQYPWLYERAGPFRWREKA